MLLTQLLKVARTEVSRNPLFFLELFSNNNNNNNDNNNNNNNNSDDNKNKETNNSQKMKKKKRHICYKIKLNLVLIRVNLA